jgi:predicted anti-sigma-YlaC factor YlaD
MSCDEMTDLIEPIAAGDLVPGASVEAHLASCAACRASVDRARVLERLLQERPAPTAPPQFTSRALARIRRDQWRREQWLDTGFNIVVASLVLAVVVALWLVIDRTGIVTLSNDAVDMIAQATITLLRRIAPEVPLYAAATALIMAAVGVWWWAERDITQSW